MEKLTHRQLVNDLANHLEASDTIVFREPCIGRGGSPMPDILRMRKSYTRTNISAYEVKASRSDLMQDVKNTKWENYLHVCDRFFFAIGNDFEYKDIIEHLPVGIIRRSKSGWTTPRAAPLNPHRQPLDEETSLALLMHQSNKHRPKESRLSKLEVEREILLKDEVKNLYRLHNKKLADRISDVQRREQEVRHLEAEQRREIKEQIFTALNLRVPWYRDDEFVQAVVNRLFLEPFVEIVKDGGKKLEQALSN